jgi:hypothetical protein
MKFSSSHDHIFARPAATPARRVGEQAQDVRRETRASRPILSMRVPVPAGAEN